MIVLKGGVVNKNSRQITIANALCMKNIIFIIQIYSNNLYRHLLITLSRDKDKNIKCSKALKGSTTHNPKSYFVEPVAQGVTVATGGPACVDIVKPAATAYHA